VGWAQEGNTNAINETIKEGVKLNDLFKYLDLDVVSEFMKCSKASSDLATQFQDGTLFQPKANSFPECNGPDQERRYVVTTESGATYNQTFDSEAHATRSMLASPLNSYELLVCN